MAALHASVLRVELLMRDVHSLKAKRSIVKGISQHLRTTFNVAVAEVDHHDLWQRSALGIAAVAGTAGQVERILHSVLRDLERDDRCELLGSAVSHLEEPE